MRCFTFKVEVLHKHIKWGEEWDPSVGALCQRLCMIMNLTIFLIQIWIHRSVGYTLRNSFLLQKILSCDRKLCPLTENFVVWQEISSFNMKFLHVAQSSLNIFFCFAGSFFCWQEISAIFHPSDIKSWQKCVIFFVVPQNCNKMPWF